MKSINLFIRVIHIFHIAYKPGISASIRIKHRSSLSILKREYEISCIQHVQHWKCICIHLSHITACFRKFRENSIHLAMNMLLYHFLITAKFGCMITSNAFMPIGCIILVECIYSQVQHPVIQRFVLQYFLVCFRRLQIWFHLCTFRHELLVVQISFVHSPHIHQTQQSYKHYSNLRFQFSNRISIY